jgi:hypothetical protein
LESSGAGGDEGQRVFGVDVEGDASVFGTEIARAMGAVAAAAVAGRFAEDDIGREVFVREPRP